MRKGMRVAVITLMTAVALGLSACAGGSGSAGGARSATPAGPALSSLAASSVAGGSSYDEGLTRVVDPSRAAGGTLTFELAGRPDSLDYQDTGDPFVSDFARLYSMQLLTYKSCPGTCGLQLVPDLATGLGQVSDHGLLWTYRLRPGVRFQNGETVTAADVKYGIERTYARAVLPYGPDTFQALLADPGYGGPYSAPASSLTSVIVPNPTTIQFRLAAPFADFNYVVAGLQSTPVPASWDTGRHRGARFQLDPISSGPYEFRSYTPGQRLVLVRNPYWKQATDPQVRQLPGEIIVTMGRTQTAVDASVLAGSADADLSGTGLTGQAAAKVLGSTALKANSDDPFTGLAYFAYLNTHLIPDVHCREAIEYAADKTAMLAAYGGPAAAAIATAVLPPTVLGYRAFAGSAASGDGGASTASAAAKSQLRLCGQASGFATAIAFPAGEPETAAAAGALRESLAGAGIRARLESLPASSYYSAYAGDPAYVQSHDLGIVMGEWRAAWPDGYAFLDELSDGDAIAYGGGNANIAEIDDPVINSLFTRAIRNARGVASAATWPQIDNRIMDLAAILPIADQRALLYRSPQLTNVYADECYGMYNYAVLGVR